MGSTDSLHGLCAIVTGGASGIGLATASLLAARGAGVACLDLNTRVPSPLASLRCDVTDDASVSSAVEEATRFLGGLDIVVNNAGIGAQGTIEEGELDEWQHVFDVNVFGIVRVTRAAMPHLRRSTAASVVNTCSIVSTAGLPRRALYSASKGAVLSLTMAMAADDAPQGIRVNCVNPGTVDTQWVRRLIEAAADSEAELETLRRRQPIGRLVTAQEVASAICYLASPDAAATTGTALPVDGGMQGLRLQVPTIAR
jgi:NAD(P)-dependent dehydrogenase (short-subunit alcohol dehydrogenase family)